MTGSLLLTKRKKKGFTLIELIVVIAILAIIALIAIPKYLSYQEDARKKSDISNAKSIATATATLISQGKTFTSPITLTPGADATDATAGAGLIESQLQSTPKPQAKSSASTTAAPATFVITIDANSNITVNTTGGDTTKDQLYPTPGDTYK